MFYLTLLVMDNSLAWDVIYTDKPDFVVGFDAVIGPFLAERIALAHIVK